MIYLSREFEYQEFISDFDFGRQGRIIGVKGYKVFEQQGFGVEEDYIDATDYFLIKSPYSAFYIVSTKDIEEITDSLGIKLLELKVFSVYDRNFHPVRFSELVDGDVYKNLKEHCGKILSLDAYTGCLIPINIP